MCVENDLSIEDETCVEHEVSLEFESIDLKDVVVDTTEIGLECTMLLLGLSLRVNNSGSRYLTKKSLKQGKYISIYSLS
jgi:hypothetical protein